MVGASEADERHQPKADEKPQLDKEENVFFFPKEQRILVGFGSAE